MASCDGFFLSRHRHKKLFQSREFTNPEEECMTVAHIFSRNALLVNFLLIGRTNLQKSSVK